MIFLIAIFIAFGLRGTCYIYYFNVAYKLCVEIIIVCNKDKMLAIKNRSVVCLHN